MREQVIETTTVDPSIKNYSSEELDLLALFFTLIKVIYVAGAVHLLPPLCRLLGTIFQLSLAIYLRVHLKERCRTDAARTGAAPDDDPERARVLLLHRAAARVPSAAAARAPATLLCRRLPLAAARLAAAEMERYRIV
jgi:hypothetical protein